MEKMSVISISNSSNLLFSSVEIIVALPSCISLLSAISIPSLYFSKVFGVSTKLPNIPRNNLWNEWITNNSK